MSEVKGTSLKPHQAQGKTLSISDVVNSPELNLNMLQSQVNDVIGNLQEQKKIFNIASTGAKKQFKVLHHRYNMLEEKQLEVTKKQEEYDVMLTWLTEDVDISRQKIESLESRFCKHLQLSSEAYEEVHDEKENLMNEIKKLADAFAEKNANVDKQIEKLSTAIAEKNAKLDTKVAISLKVSMVKPNDGGDLVTSPSSFQSSSLSKRKKVDNNDEDRSRRETLEVSDSSRKKRKAPPSSSRSSSASTGASKKPRRSVRHSARLAAAHGSDIPTCNTNLHFKTSVAKRTKGSNRSGRKRFNRF